MLKIEFSEKARKSIAYEENIIIGLCEYIEENGSWNIIHTEVSSEYQGKGIARKLVNTIQEEANKRSVTLVADCSYANKIINNNK